MENTKKVVEFLANHPQVEKVNHPSLPDHPDHALYEKYFPNGGASIFTFDIKGGRKEAFEFIDHLKIFSLLANVADVKSLVIHPATTTHSQLTDEELAEQQIYQNTLRLSIGTPSTSTISSPTSRLASQPSAASDSPAAALWQNVSRFARNVPFFSPIFFLFVSFRATKSKAKSGCEAAALLCVTNLYLGVNTFFKKF